LRSLLGDDSLITFKSEANGLSHGKKRSEDSSKETKVEKEEVKCSFTKAKNDVFQLGISGFSKEDKQAAKIAHLIKLGAKPPKKECTNYKKLMEERKKEKLVLSQESIVLDTEQMKLGRISQRKTTKNSKKKKDKNEVPKFDSAFGKVKKRFKPKNASSK